eukprot:gene5812-11967_t
MQLRLAARAQARADETAKRTEALADYAHYFDILGSNNTAAVGDSPQSRIAAIHKLGALSAVIAQNGTKKDGPHLKFKKDHHRAAVLYFTDHVGEHVPSAADVALVTTHCHALYSNAVRNAKAGRGTGEGASKPRRRGAKAKPAASALAGVKLEAGEGTVKEEPGEGTVKEEPAEPAAAAAPAKRPRAAYIVLSDDEEPADEEPAAPKPKRRRSAADRLAAEREHEEFVAERARRAAATAPPGAPSAAPRRSPSPVQHWSEERRREAIRAHYAGGAERGPPRFLVEGTEEERRDGTCVLCDK